MVLISCAASAAPLWDLFAQRSRCKRLEGTSTKASVKLLRYYVRPRDRFVHLRACGTPNRASAREQRAESRSLLRSLASGRIRLEVATPPGLPASKCRLCAAATIWLRHHANIEVFGREFPGARLELRSRAQSALWTGQVRGSSNLEPLANPQAPRGGATLARQVAPEP